MSIPDHLITPLDWSAEALRHAAAWTGQPEGARALVESRLYLAMHELIERLQAEADALRRERDELAAQVSGLLDEHDELVDGQAGLRAKIRELAARLAEIERGEGLPQRGRRSAGAGARSGAGGPAGV